MKKLMLFFIIFIYQTSVAQIHQDTLALIEKIFERYQATSPGCQLAISQNNRIVFSKAWGIADLEHRVSLTTESIIEAGSVSKQFTAAAILLLQQTGKLSLNDDVRKYIPELPDYETVITLQHLIHHTSGIKDWGSIMAFSDWPRGTKIYSNNDVLNILVHQQSLNNKPGDEYLYSNSNYVLLSIIVERITGKSLEEFTRSFIFEPAGMKHTQWRSNLNRIVPDRAIAYRKSNSTYFTDMPFENVYGNGGLLTTAEDLLRWNNYFLSGKLGSPSLLPNQLSVIALNNGRKNAYAAGLRIDSLRGWKAIMHDGATAAYRSTLEYYPDLKLSIAWLSNTSEFDGGREGLTELRDLLLKDKSPINGNAKIDTILVAPKILTTYAGWYKDRLTNTGIGLIVKNDKLQTTNGKILVPIAENEFILGSSRIKFQSDQKRPFYIKDENGVIYENVEEADNSPAILKDCIGEYYSDEVEAKLSISIENDKLVIHRNSNTKFTLNATYKDGFDIENSSIRVLFERDKKHKIKSLKFTSPRVRNITFKKLQ
ncbi:serine hydrolase [Pedobacter foliorum]|uniref:serine hydrolase domain-containing protein n=1 Tax=Pedobacter foliorum TaxID=2739058 RepID=UPI0015665A19|nr:serine hydrolase domain-containing protein [Pedobacter foliorum]NRF38351.1 beta-lactamase family protein [Pedobacter foliorum]